MRPEQAEMLRPLPRPMRRPFVPLFLSVMLGIVIDNYVSPTTTYTIGAGVLMLVVVGLAVRRSAHSLAALGMLGLTTVIGQAWHHVWIHERVDNDLAEFLRLEPQLCWLEGAVCSDPVCLPKPPDGTWRDVDRTRFELEVQRRRAEHVWLPTAGRLAVRVEGLLNDMRAGDEVRLLCQAQLPTGPRNAGEFDYRQHLIRRRVRGVGHCQSAAAVDLLRRPPPSTPDIWRSRIIGSASQRLRQVLPDDLAKLAITILLGQRSALSNEEIIPYLESGTLHLLVVSGSHLAILAGGAWLVTGGWLSLRARAVVVMLLAIGYAYLTGSSPPAVRAAVILVVFSLGTILHRPTDALNSLAGAGLVVLGLNPTDLFNSGAQLSFLAVLTLLLICPALQIRPTPTLDRQIRWSTRCGVLVINSLMVSLAISLVSAPMCLDRFHLLSPIGVLLTPLLLAPMTVVMGAGLGFLVGDAISHSLGLIWIWPLHAGLWLFQSLVRWSEDLPGAWTYLPAFPWLWTIGFYLLLWLPRCLSNGLYGWRQGSVLAVYVLLGAVLVGRPTLPTTTQYHQLAVGHGCCGVLRTPAGQTVLFDCGSMAGEAIADRVIAPWLWSQGVGSIDAVFLSHADADHYNGLPVLARKFPIRRVFLPVQMTRSPEAPIAALKLLCGRAGIGMQTVGKEDRIRLGSVDLDVLLPAPAERHPTDNSGSLAILCRIGPHRLIQTGDLERVGLTQFLEAVREPVDVLICPHHGSPASNPPAMATTLQPKLAISSQGYRPSKTDPLAGYRAVGAEVLKTHEIGSIDLSFGAQLRWRAFRPTDPHPALIEQF